MAFIVPGVCQFSLHHQYAGRNVVNVLSYKIDTTGSAEDRPTAIFNMAGILINEWGDSVLPQLGAALSFTSVSWVDLNSADGSVGARTSSANWTLPKIGGVALASMPGNAAILVRKTVQAQRGARQGRMYLCGVPETYTDSTNSNTLIASTITTLQGKMTSFLGDTNQTGIPTTAWHSKMNVVHVLTREPDKPNGRPGDPLTGVGLEVSALTVQQTLATQRRRLRG